jgi:GNAT superfamily N-acetyltransferase
LRGHRDDSIEIAYFGLMPEFVGQGLGKYLLARAVEAAWAEKPSRVWLHTCTLDHPSALPNYLKRGFRRVRDETYRAVVEK